MVAVGTTTLAQRRHDGRRWHNYVGATLSQRQQIVLGQRIFANHMPMMSAMLEKIRSENTCSLIFWRGTCFYYLFPTVIPRVKYKINHKTGF